MTYMQKAAISSKYFLVEGGCNACGFKNATTFTIHFEDHSADVLECLDIPSLVKAIAQKNGWREVEIIRGINDEYLVLKKGTQVIEPKYMADQVLYQTTDQRIQTNQTFSETTDLFEKTNEILATVFDIEPYQLAIAEP